MPLIAKCLADPLASLVFANIRGENCFAGAAIQNQRTNGPVNAHLISWPSKAQNIQNLENIWYRNDLDLQYSHTFIYSISCLHLPTFRSLAAIVSEKSTVFTFPIEKPKLPNLTLP